MKVVERTAAFCCLMLVLAGCAHGANRSPRELLSLSVSGLSGVDRYGFSGETAIGMGSQPANKPVAFQGTVRNHDQVNVQGAGMNALSAPIHPLQFLNEVEDMALNTEIVPEESNDQRTVLRITADPKKAAGVWSDRLRGEFAVLEKKVPANASANRQSKQLRTTAAQSALQDEWHGELARSKKELEAMLSTMQVQSVCKLVIDRKKLMPLSLDEQTVFHYFADGKPAEENRRTKLTFKRF